MTPEEALERASRARVGRIATVRPDGTPHVVPFVFALVRGKAGARVYWAVDDKPKRSTALARIENLRVNPAAEIVVDEYDDVWSRLWWVRLRGAGRVVSEPEERRAALAALAKKYPAYRERPPGGEVVAVDIRSVTSWAASERP